MKRPMTSQMTKRNQVMMGRPVMSRKQKTMLSTGMTGRREPESRDGGPARGSGGR